MVTAVVLSGTTPGVQFAAMRQIPETSFQLAVVLMIYVPVE
jgi:hypothetical protein